MHWYDALVTIASITPERPWGIGIPNYFWFTGSSAAAFIISSFANVFGFERYRPIAGFSLLLAFVLLAVAPLNLIDDLQQPGRLDNFFLYGWSHLPTSPMKWGVPLLIAYPILILAEALMLYHRFFLDRMEQARSSLGKGFYRALALGRTRDDEASRARDEKIGFYLGAVGIPLAIAVHGYTGYILGVVYANPLWASAMMPLLFLASAMVSGAGLLLVLVPLAQRYFTDLARVDGELMTRLARLLSWFIIIDLLMRLFWLTFAMPFAGQGREELYSFFGPRLQEVVLTEYVAGLLVPLLIGFSPLGRQRFWQVAGGVIAAVGVWMFRWNTVIGGESLDKTTAGLLVYHPHWFGQASITSTLANWAVFVALLSLVMLLFPWDKEMETHYKRD